ncbi:polysaccharide biosynthesis C-terminal domain-containing protein [Aerococcus viridans]|uniref:polysaccharide biosynthesis C-terminal domain-containing protein n=1 Tax=Aerococcus viridans TaxID=1377 RepID=UPI00223BC2F5|nr:polysaccharide biosynthesis C-terminal domain-containing protein [Aerococcus viridans]MCT1797323.1 polysaccharide biosynthesis C-terminal domain-containing protein [Aerococcus viridans]
MNRYQKLKLNTYSSIFNKVTIVISGLILPRLILMVYGSEINGMVTSIGQFLNIITFLDLGVGSVVESSLYKPMATGDNQEISRVATAAKNYFRKISYFILIYIILLMIIYPNVVNGNLNYISTAMLIVAMSVNTFAQYYFGIVNELILNSDQRSYIQLFSESVTVIFSLIVSTILIYFNLPISAVKLISGLVFLLRPLYLSFYVRSHYNIDFNETLVEDPIKQKWNGMAQHIAWAIQNSSDIVILTIFSSLEMISIYSIYRLVINGINTLVQAMTNGLKSFLGNLIVSESQSTLNTNFGRIEWFFHNFVILLYGLASVLIGDFIRLYTSGVKDVNYVRPIFAIVMVLSGVMQSIRIPYKSLILSAGHFKNTQNIFILEAAINIVVSVLLVNYLDLIGVGLGTLIAMSVGTFYMVHYLSKNIIFRDLSIFFKHVVVDIIMYILMLILGNLVIEYITISNMFVWFVSAIIVGLVFIIIQLIVNFIFYNKETNQLFFKISQKFRG